jgi:hypothetical protein
MIEKLDAGAVEKEEPGSAFSKHAGYSGAA